MTKKQFKIAIINGSLFLIVCILAIVDYNTPDKVVNNGKELVEESSASSLLTTQSMMEYAYFEGQKDALEGHVRIAKDTEGCWEWTESPWDERKLEPVYEPEC